MKSSKKREKKNVVAPYESAPVISREGKIGRRTAEIINEKAAGTGVESPCETLPEHAGEVTISDSAFMKNKPVQQKKKRRVHTVTSKEKSPFPIMTLIFCVICTVLFMSMIVNLVKINEYTKDVASLQNEVKALDKTKTELSAELDQKNNAETLRKYLEEHKDGMGMVEEGMMNPPIAVTPEKNDMVEDFEAEDKEEPVISVLLNAVAQNLADAWNIFAGNE